jgi:hypothetical protein
MNASGKAPRVLASLKAFSSPLPLNGLSSFFQLPGLCWVTLGAHGVTRGLVLLALVCGEGCLELLPARCPRASLQGGCHLLLGLPFRQPYRAMMVE